MVGTHTFSCVYIGTLFIRSPFLRCPFYPQILARLKKVGSTFCFLVTHGTHTSSCVYIGKLFILSFFEMPILPTDSSKAKKREYLLFPSNPWYTHILMCVYWETFYSLSFFEMPILPTDSNKAIKK